MNDKGNIEYESNNDTDCIYYNDLVMNNGGLWSKWLFVPDFPGLVTYKILGPMATSQKAASGREYTL